MFSLEPLVSFPNYQKGKKEMHAGKCAYDDDKLISNQKKFRKWAEKMVVRKVLTKSSHSLKRNLCHLWVKGLSSPMAKRLKSRRSKH